MMTLQFRWLTTATDDAHADTVHRLWTSMESGCWALVLAQHSPVGQDAQGHCVAKSWNQQENGVIPLPDRLVRGGNGGDDGWYGGDYREPDRFAKPGGPAQQWEEVAVQQAIPSPAQYQRGKA